MNLFIVLILSTALSAFAQKSSRDYFLPAAKKNKAIFNMPDHNSKQSEFARVMYYLKKEDHYEITDTIKYHNKSTRIETRTVEFTPTEVHLIKLISTTDSESNKITRYDPPKVILKVPGIGQILTWSYKDSLGRKTNFAAEWVKFKLNNVNTRAIKITETINLSNGLLFDGKRIYYYMEGIGLWKMEGETRNLLHVIWEFEKLEYNSTIRK
ncbi:MAG: hypothetical protein ABI663_05705 [Chryseolinea sp.]